MLRAKISSNLSSGARSFFLNGSRYTADGTSYTSTDDDNTHVSKRQLYADVIKSSSTSSIPHQQQLQLQHHHKGQTFNPNSNNCGVKINTVVESNSANANANISDQVVKAGIVAATFLNDVVSYRIPSLDGNVVTNSMVDPIRTVSTITRSSNVRPTVGRDNKFLKVYPKSTASGSTHNNNNNNKGVTKPKFVVTSAAAEKNHQYNVAPNGGYEKKFVSQRSSSKLGGSNRAAAAGNFSCNNVRSSVSNNGYFEKSAKGEAAMFPRQKYGGFGHVVESASNILRQFRWGPAAEAALGKLNCSIDPFQANQILKQIQDYSVALDFFFWLKRQPRFRHDQHTYTTMVGILGHAKQFDAIDKLLDEMVRDGCQPNVVTYNRIIHSYGKANYLNEAVNVFNQMQENGCEPDRVSYCTLIDNHAKAGYFDVAMDMYHKMQAAGLTPDTFTYSVMINCLGKAGHLPSAQKLFFEMIDHGCVPNLVTYNIMIALQAKARNYESALQIYRDMKNAGFKPDKVTYSIVMEALGHCGYLDEAEAVFTEMQQNDWVPDEPVYGLLVDLWGKAGQVEKAWGWYQAMLNGGLYPNVPTCNSLLSAFLRVHRLSDAYNLLQSMHGFGLNPSLQTYTLLLSCCTEARSLYDMGCCRELMEISGHPADRFLQSMPAAGPDGENVRDHVSKFLDLMHSEDRESKRGLIDAVVDFLHKSGLKEEAGSVWEVAARKNVYPDAVKEKSSSYWLINLHVMSDGTAVTALSRTLALIRQQMLVSGIFPNRIDIVTGWGRRSRVTGTSLVREAVQELLSIFSFPFFTENGNSGCFIGSGEPLNRWLLQSYVERMHLL
ncbi:hypothetical protein ACFE04_008498 [Oxalis oulophora]